MSMVRNGARYSPRWTRIWTLETEGVVLLAESMSDGRGHGPFDMWVTPPTQIENLDAMVFPDMMHAVFDYRIGGKYVRLTPIFGSASPRF
jgi:hypothetical protein